MKRRITLSIALALSIVLVSLIKSDSTVEAQNQIRVVGDTGIVKLGPNQRLSLAAWDPWDLDNDGVYNVRIRQLNYQPTSCQAGICKYAIASQTTSPVIMLAPNETLEVTDDNPIALGGHQTRMIVLSDSQKVRVNAVVLDTSTQKIVSICNFTDAGIGVWTK